MKKLFLVFLFCALPLIASAAPYLICDPQAGVEYYKINDGGTIIKAEAQPDGSLKLDVGTVSEGLHSITVLAGNIWGESEAVPFVYTRTTLIGPAGLQLQAK